MLTLISYVAVDFRDQKTGEYIFRINKDQIAMIINAPKAIQQDPIYDMLVQDGSIRVVDKKEKVHLENDPMKGVTADGKSGVAAELAKKEEKKASEKKASEKKASEEKKEEETGK